MGNSKSIYDLTLENLETCERKVLLQSGLPDSQIQAKNVPVGMFKGEVVNIRTIIFGDEKKPVLVLIHGYG